MLFDSGNLRVSAPAYQAAIRDVLARIQATGRVLNIHSPLDPACANQISANRHAALLQFGVTGNINDSATTVVPVLAAVQAAAAAHPQIQIGETGDASIAKAVNDTVLADLHRAEALSFPITLVVLLIAFGAVVAALLPLGLATMAILAATGLAAFTSHLSGATETASAVMLLIGLAVGVDYSMFYVKREREERAAGRPVLDSIEVAAATSGRSVLISGLTVLAAMSGMFLTGSKIFYGMGVATMLVVACAVIGSLTLLRPCSPCSATGWTEASCPSSACCARRAEPDLDRDPRPGASPSGTDRRDRRQRPGHARAARAPPAYRPPGRQ